MAKTTLPGVEVAAPSTCAWWYCKLLPLSLLPAIQSIGASSPSYLIGLIDRMLDWTSDIGYTDNAAHNNQDFLPWFLSQMNNASTQAGTRLLDYLDIHYYFAADTSANDDAAKALRLRMTRSWWGTSEPSLPPPQSIPSRIYHTTFTHFLITDPGYTDESYIGSSVPAQWNEPNPNVVMLIPRMQELIRRFYPGTKLSVSEWSSTEDTDITGGLVTVDSLGIFGVNGLDQATYWSEPDEEGPIGLAYWLYRG